VATNGLVILPTRKRSRARAHPGLGFQVAVAAREADCPVPLADEEHSARHTGGDDLIQVALEVPLAGGQTVARGARGRGGGGGGEREQREWERDRPLGPGHVAFP